MARKKTVDEAVVDEQVSQEVVDTQAPQPNQKQDIPESVDKLLKSYPNYSALYIDSKGGVFPEGTQPNLVKDAILYQNPHYKS